MKFKKTIGIIGVGKMGGTLISSLLKNHVVEPVQIYGTTSREDTVEKIRDKHQIFASTDNLQIVSKSDIIILAVKPQMIKKIILQILPGLNKEKIVISIAAAISTNFIEEKINKSVPVIRAMPNTASLVNEGMTVLCPGKYVSKEHLEPALKIFKSIGQVEVIYREELMDAVTALSGSGPAYSYLMIESLTDGGVRMGLPRELARKLAAQSVLGGAKMILETGLHPALLKDEVTTPAGVTIDGLMELEDGGFRVALIKAIDRATHKSKQISK
ncbi:MAG: pyrroline-5-carboxylate reductase [Candidatus Caldatribacteriota bacterium]|jgi:pyrroline-5-carboxylate reductase|nr:pyrroline-5-carboxylate reductase [Atribacterota bacterium]MDD3031811.1 pyrroline-5-carboxylate reductase [Atribacterota bacterium]MDD3640993.1 pyrroline-5-carboxylate reductase [Atribacterota bacterium]MDD4289190.1 pyrroline-5-carboxylate reductase [Atribacterota bacterium]MDD4765506.1 pyrroline-5-carboxylate reductase [Atribacterota bacterium]